MADRVLLRGAGDAARAELLASGQSLSFATGAELFRQGERSTSLVLVVEGKAKIWRAALDGSSITLVVVGPGRPIGTLHAAYDLPHTATATALESTRAHVWPIGQIRRIMHADPAVTENVLGLVARYAARMIERVEEVSVGTVEARVARALCRATNFAMPLANGSDLIVSRQDIAEMSSSTLATVSRIMSRWRASGLISGQRGRVRILDLAGLRGIAGWAE